MTRNLITIVIALTTLSMSAQQVVPNPASQPSAGSDWLHVQALPMGQSISVKARSGHASCTLRTVDADSLTCSGKKDLVFQRTDILAIKVPRRGRSALIGLGIGAGAGVIVGAATGCSSAQKSQPWGCFVTPTRGQAAGILAALFGGIGAGVGVATDFAKATVYRAP